MGFKNPLHEFSFSLKMVLFIAFVRSFVFITLRVSRSRAHAERLMAWAGRFNNSLFDVSGLKGDDLLTH